MRVTIADRLRARCKQVGLTASEAGRVAGVNQSLVYDILRGKSEHPNRENLDKLAQALKVTRDWLLYGVGEVDGGEPMMVDPQDVFVAIPYVSVRPSMGGGTTVDDEPEHGRPYHFQKSWIRHGLRSKPDDLRVCQVEGDSMLPTLNGGDIVLLDTARRSPTPPGIFVLHDGMGLVAKRLEHIPNSDPPRVRVISDNPVYAPYERTADEVNIVGRIRWLGRSI